MMRPIVAFALACCLALVSGCASTPSRFYTLSASAVPGTTASNVSVLVGPVSVPSTVDRPQIVLMTDANQVSIDEFSRWASPLPENLAGVVAENLAAMLGTPRVTQSQSILVVQADYRVQIEVRNFVSVPDQYTSLDAIWAVRRTKDGKTASGRTTAREPIQGSGIAALVAAHSRGVARMSGEIADAVRMLDRG